MHSAERSRQMDSRDSMNPLKNPLLEKIINQHSIVSMTDIAGRITYVNDKFCEVSGFSREELLGADHRIVKSSAHSPEFYRDMWRTVAQGDTWQGQVQNCRKDGSDYWVQTTIMPVLNAQGKPEQYISLRTDVTAQVRAQRALAQFKATLDQTLDSVFIIDVNTLRFSYVNLGATEQVGYTEPELLAMGPTDIKPDFDEEQYRAVLAPLVSGELESFTLETRHQHKSGRCVPVEIFMQYFPEGENSGQCIAIVRDISERRRTEHTLAALTVAQPSREVFQDIVKTMAESLDARWVGIVRITEKGCPVQLMGFWDSGHPGDLMSYDQEGSPCADVCASHQSLTVHEQVASRYPEFVWLQRIGAVSYRGEPLLGADDAELGVLFVVDDKPCGESATDRVLMGVAAKRAALELQRLNAEEVAQARNLQLYETLGRVSDGFFSLDDQWCFTYLNPSAANMFQTSWFNLKGRSIWEAFPEAASFFRTPLRQAMQQQSRVWFEGLYQPQDRWLGVYIYPSSAGVSVYLQDVSENKRLKLEHERLAEQMQQAQKMEAIGQLTAGIAHDFNNILASIIGYTDLAQTRCVGEGQEKLSEYLAQVYKAGERARDLIQQMMVYSRTSSAEAVTQDPTPLVKETLKLLASTLPAGIRLELECPEDDTLIINVEPVQLQQMVMNLCINARDAMHGKGRLTLTLARVKHLCTVCGSCHEDICGDFVELKVMDSGEGMALGARQHLFEPFFTTKDVGKGTGLGLSVVHGIMHEHRGHIRVESRPGEGTAFCLLFPVVDKKTKCEATSGQGDCAAKNPQKLATGQRVLLVDDEEPLLNLVQTWLMKQGYDVQAFSNAKDALASFETDPQHIDLLITDHAMPGMTGLELIGAVRVLRADLPVLLCSGYTNPDNLAQAHSLNVTRLLDKPFERGSLLELVGDMV
ncbi:MAG: PAS domain S-box protein [Gammaproteobacteria bacterium]|nr:PAS domain S-box protein [Gammaproteobacteria bacterium]